MWETKPTTAPQKTSRLLIGPKQFTSYVIAAAVVAVCVLYVPQNIQRPLPYLPISGWFYNRDIACLLRGTNSACN